MLNIDCLFIHVPHLAKVDEGKIAFFTNKIALGVFSICSELTKFGYIPQIINLGIEKAIDVNFDIAKYIRENNIKIVGLSLNWYSQVYDTLIVAQHIKRMNPDTFVFLGGMTSSAFAIDILNECTEIDAVVKGEGEKPIVNLVESFKKNISDFSDISNLVWRNKNGNICINEKNWFASEDELNSFKFDKLEYLKNLEIYLRFPSNYENSFLNYKGNNLLSSPVIDCCLGRGCLGNCTWCGGGYEATKQISGRNKLAIRKPKVVANEILNLKEKYQNINFCMSYDPCPYSQDYLVELFNILGEAIPKQVHVEFECFAVPTKEFIDAFGKNLKSTSKIILSPEFGDENMRKIHRSFYFSNTEFLNSLDYIISKNIHLGVYFAELSFESEKSKNETRLLIEKVAQRKEKFPFIEIYHQCINNLEPFSPWAINPEKYGLQVAPTFKDYYCGTKVIRDFT